MSSHSLFGFGRRRRGNDHLADTTISAAGIRSAPTTSAVLRCPGLATGLTSILNSILQLRSKTHQCVDGRVDLAKLEPSDLRLLHTEAIGEAAL